MIIPHICNINMLRYTIQNNNVKNKDIESSKISFAGVVYQCSPVKGIAVNLCNSLLTYNFMESFVM